MVELPLTFHFISVWMQLLNSWIGTPTIILFLCFLLKILTILFWTASLISLGITYELFSLNLKTSLLVTLTTTFTNSKNKMRRNVWSFFVGIFSSIWSISYFCLIPDSIYNSLSCRGLEFCVPIWHPFK